MRGQLISVWTIGSLLAFAAAHAQTTPEMPNSVARFWKRLGMAKTITYTMKDWAYDRIGWMSNPWPGSQIFYVEHTYEVKAQRPNRLSISISPGIEREVILGAQRQRQFLNPGDGVYINNGKQSITYQTLTHTYTVGEGLDALAKDRNDHAVHLQIFWIFNEKPMDGYRLVPESLLEPSTTVIYTLSVPKEPDYQQRIYFDRKTGNLTQASDFDKDDKGNWKENSRQDFLIWDFDGRLPADTFNVRPLRTYITQEEFNKIYNIPAAQTVPK